MPANQPVPGHPAVLGRDAADQASAGLEQADGRKQAGSIRISLFSGILLFWGGDQPKRAAASS
ncbi:hypothetical protein [Microbacterium mangrovi]|uniref:hypothetical protein n=1 Tax=Microbacterium mangrovi TaxID=1348253 RepID=UPI0012E06C1E|nr:hypothetical protein [Microbacterium mangrovi]